VGILRLLRFCGNLLCRRLYFERLQLSFRNVIERCLVILRRVSRCGHERGSGLCLSEGVTYGQAGFGPPAG
jgi:hypothetical protein